MSVFIAGGTGFIGRRLTRTLVGLGRSVIVMDIAPQDGHFDDLGDKVRVVRGDISQFDDVMDKMSAAEADRVINLAYYIGNHHPPHVAMKLNVIGMDNFFEAARLMGAKRVVYASSLAVYNFQRHYGEREVNEDDYKHGDNQYSMHKIFNEWQAQDYRDKFGMSITGVRPTNVSGPDKIFGSVDHVKCIVRPARGKPARLSLCGLHSSADPCRRYHGNLLARFDGRRPSTPFIIRAARRLAWVRLRRWCGDTCQMPISLSKMKLGVRTSLGSI